MRPLTGHVRFRLERRIPSWAERAIGGIHWSFDSLAATEREFKDEIRFNSMIKVGIGAEGPAEIEEFRDPDEISLGGADQSARQAIENLKHKPRKSLKVARSKLTTEEREDEEVRKFMRRIMKRGRKGASARSS